MVSTRAQHVVRGEISDVLSISSYLPCGKVLVGRPRLVGYSGEKHILRFFYFCEYRLYICIIPLLVSHQPLIG